MTTFSIYELPYLRPHFDRVRAAQEAAAAQPNNDKSDLLLLADGQKLRGIPAVGRWTSGGHIAGTQPEAVICR